MASLFEFTVNDILTLISDLKGETSVDTSAMRIRAVDRASKDFALRREWQLFRIPDLTVVGNGTATYTLGSASYPARPSGLLEVFVTTTGSSNMTPESSRKEIISFEDFKSKYNDNASADIAYQYFDVVANEWKIKINPTPAATETITYSYYWMPPTVTTTAGKVYCYDPLIIARLANAYIYEYEDEDKYQDQLQISESLIQRWEMIEDGIPVGQSMQMSSPISGIGDINGNTI